MSDWVLAHLGFVVSNMESALKRFVREGAKIKIHPTEDPLQKVSVALLTGSGGEDIELVAPINDPENSPIKGRLTRGGGLDHICYFVNNLEAALAMEQSRGGVLVCPQTYAVAFDCHIAFVYRRSGLLVELMTTNHTGDNHD